MNPESTPSHSIFRSVPLLAAIIITVLNAGKPAVIDDTAYLFFARHIAQDPLQPYSFTLFWYSQPDPAMEILLPPVLPYWLALGMAIFGDDVILLKLWLFPFAFLLCRSLASILRRFAPSWERLGIWLFALSPFVLSLFSIMLDVPALALGTTAIAVFLRSFDTRNISLVMFSGLIAALAIQTKYSMMTVPAVCSLYAILQKPRRFHYAVLMGLCTLFAAATWECFVWKMEGRSHFLVHLREQSNDTSFAQRLANAKGLFMQFGGLAWGLGLLALAVARLPRWFIIGCAILFAVFIGLICVLPRSATFADAGELDGVAIAYQFFASVSTFATIAAFIRHLVNRGFSRDAIFLAGWLLGEVVAMWILTPFPAARRLVGVGLALCVVILFLLHHAEVSSHNRWLLRIAIAWGLLHFSIEAWDAQAERVIAMQAAEVAKPEGDETVWYTGHWGFQYYAERAGMKPFVTHQTALRAGDWLVLPMMPHEHGFYRPWPPDRTLPREDMQVEFVRVLTWDDPISAQTIPNLHGGSLPLVGRDFPRLTVHVYRVRSDWKLKSN